MSATVLRGFLAESRARHPRSSKVPLLFRIWNGQTRGRLFDLQLVFVLVRRGERDHERQSEAVNIGSSSISLDRLRMSEKKLRRLLT